MPRYVLLLFLFILKFGYAGAQINEAELVNFTQQGGLPSNEAYCVFRDSKDFIWIATDQGVVRFNGSTMQKFDLPDNVVFKIREDAKGRIWFFTHTGKLSYFKDEKVWPYQYNDSIMRYSRGLLITDAYIADNDEITLNAIIDYNYKIRKNGSVERTHDNVTDEMVIEITEPKPGKLFTQKTSFALPYYVNRLTIKRFDKRHRTYSMAMKELKPYTHCGSSLGNDGVVYTFIGPWLLKLNKDGGFSTREMPGSILSLYRDSISGLLYCGLVKAGIYVVDSVLNQVQHLMMGGKSVTSINTDSEGGFWFTTLENGAYFSGSRNIFKKHFARIIERETQRIYNYNDRYLLAASSNQLDLLDGKNKKMLLRYDDTEVNDFFIQKRGKAFILSFLGFKNQFVNTPVKIHPFNRIFTLRLGHETVLLNDSIRLANLSHRLTCLNLNILTGNKLPYYKSFTHYPSPGFNIQAIFLKDSFSVFLASMYNLHVQSLIDSTIKPFKPAKSIFNKGVTYIQQMKNGILAMGIRFGGVALLKDTTILANITEADGLINNSIKYILPDGDRLWLATPKGISVIQFTSYDPVRYMIRNFGESAGIFDLIIYQLIKFKGNILAATSKGVYEISNVETLLKEQAPPIPFYITSVNYYRGDTSGIKTLTVPYNKNRIKVAFSAVCFTSPKQLQYFYRFKNKDSAWFNINNTELILENLSPGNYELEIKAVMLEENRVSAIETLTIIVNKPWWQRADVLGLSSLVFFAGFYFFYRRRINQIRKREEEKTRLKIQIADLEQTALRSQMNPHFIFNCLTSIQQLVVTGNKEEANEYLVKFARLIRKTLEYSNRSYITIEEEMDYLREYVVLEQLRIPGKFEFLAALDQDLNTEITLIPNMTLQPIVENSIRHGIKHLEKSKGIIRIEMRQEGRYICCTVSDNGVGRRMSMENTAEMYWGEKSYGMEIVRKRLNVISGNEENESLLEVEDMYNADGSAAGTKVIVRMPFKKISNDQSNSY